MPRQFDPFSTSYYSNPPPGVRWAPGQYAKIEYWQQKSTGEKAAINSDLTNFNWLRGILWQIRWADHELSQGVFNKTLMQDWYDRCASRGKYCFFLMPMRQFSWNPDTAGVVESWILPPDLMVQNGTYLNGVRRWTNMWSYIGFHTGLGGYNMNLFDPDLRARYLQFLAYIAAEFDHLPYFGGIMFTESAAGEPTDAFVGGNSTRNHFAGVASLYKAANLLFPQSLVFCDVNFDNTFATDMCGATAADGLVANGLSFTTSDYHTGSNLNGILPLVAGMVGKIPIGMQLQNLAFSRIDGAKGPDPVTNPEPTMDYLLNRAVVTYPSNYFFIQRNYPSTSPFYWDDWCNYMQSSAYANDLYGGMHPEKPLRLK